MNLEQTLRAAFVLREPAPGFEDAVMTRLAAAAWRRSQTRRRSGRIILWGTVLAMVAAAALLTMRPQVPVPRASSVTPMPSPALEPVSAVAAAEVAAAAEPVPRSLEQAVVPGAIKPFTVLVLSPGSGETEAVNQEVLFAMHSALLDNLRKVPGLVLLQLDPKEKEPQGQPNYRITITIGAESALASGHFAGEILTETLKPDGTVQGGSYMGFSGDTTSRCANARSEKNAALPPCTDPRGVAADLVETLRIMVFPPDPSVRRLLLARLLDRSLDAAGRMKALSGLGSLGRARPGVARAGPGPGVPAIEALRDPDVVRAAIDLATTAPDPAQRAWVWAMVRYVESAELVGPLLTALQQDADGEVRLLALGTLATDFRDDARVRQAFEAAALHDERPLVRAAAQRIHGGPEAEAAWRDYIVASLKDKSRPGMERVEALYYELDLPTTPAAAVNARQSGSRSILRMLDDEAIRALAEVLPATATGSPTQRQSATILANYLGNIDNPAVTDMLLASLNQGDWIYRETAVHALATVPARRKDARVRAMLEKISESDQNPELRQFAARSLQQEQSSTADSKPPRFLINLLGLQEGDALLEIDGSPVTTASELLNVLNAVPRGVDVDVVIDRQGKNVTLKARF